MKNSENQSKGISSDYLEKLLKRKRFYRKLFNKK